MSFDEWDDWDDEPAASKQREAVSPISPAEITAITVEFRKYLIDLVDERVRTNLNEKLARNTDFGRFMDYYYKVSFILVLILHVFSYLLT